jgi:hypothetical protein
MLMVYLIYLFITIVGWYKLILYMLMVYLIYLFITIVGWYKLILY